MAMIEPVRIPKTAEVVARVIRGRIVKGELAEGSFLPSEAELLQQFRVSRPTLREAFRILESERLIALRRGARNGAQVLAPRRDVAARFAGLVLQASGATLADVLAARLLLFPPAAGMLAADHSASDIEQLRAIRAEMESASDDARRFIRLAADFNLRIVELTRSPSLLLLAGMLDDIIDQADANVVGEWTSRPSARRDHIDAVLRSTGHLLELIESGDASATEDFWRKEMESSRQYTLKVLGAKTVLDLLE